MMNKNRNPQEQPLKYKAIKKSQKTQSLQKKLISIKITTFLWSVKRVESLQQKQERRIFGGCWREGIDLGWSTRCGFLWSRTKCPSGLQMVSVMTPGSIELEQWIINTKPIYLGFPFGRGGWSGSWLVITILPDVEHLKTQLEIG